MENVGIDYSVELESHYQFGVKTSYRPLILAFSCYADPTYGFIWLAIKSFVFTRLGAGKNGTFPGSGVFIT